MNKNVAHPRAMLLDQNYEPMSRLLE
jgi:hypothetical protein